MRLTTKQFNQITDVLDTLALPLLVKNVSWYAIDKDLRDKITLAKIGQQIMDEVKQQNDLDVC